MLIRKSLSSLLIKRYSLNCGINKQIYYKRISSIKPALRFSNSPLQHICGFGYSKEKILQQFEQLNRELDIKQNSVQKQNQTKRNQYLEKQQTIIKDFLQLTEDSLDQYLQNHLNQNYLIDPEILLMILSSLQNPLIINSNLPKIYPFIPTLKNTQLLLLFQLILTHKPASVPPLTTVAPRPLQNIESILLILSQLYPKDEKIVEWVKQVPLYKGEKVCVMAAGFFSIIQRMDPHLRFKNQKVIQRCMARIIDLTLDQTQQVKITILLLALQSPSTAHFAQQLLIELQSLDYSEIDPLKTQLFFIELQKHIHNNYGETRKLAKTKTQYKILEETPEGEITERHEQEYKLPEEIKSLQYGQISQIEKFKFLNSLCKNTLEQIINFNWNQTLKLNLLLQYWSLIQTFQKAYPWNSFQARLVTFTCEKQIIQKLTNLTTDELLSILSTMEKLKINKSQLLMKCLALLSQKLDILETNQLVQLTRICVTFVRQCEDFLITVRKEIESRKFMFSDQQIDELNSIFKRVLVLFPRPLVK